jgi:hypothetical protein
MEINVTKLTDVNLLRKAASFTTGNDCKMSLKTAYRLNHSLSRTQIFTIELKDIPLFVASQLVRSHVGVQFFQRSKRPDRGGADFRTTCEYIADRVFDYGGDDDEIQFLKNEILELPEKFDRYAPTDLFCVANADAIINMAHRRLCTMASKETREIMQGIVDAIETVDPDLADHCVPMCIYRGGAVCSEYKPCRYYETETGKRELKHYLSLFEKK